MTLTQEDKTWLADALKSTKSDLCTAITNTETKLGSAISGIGKRTSRLEHAFSLLSRAARTGVVEHAKRQHETLLQRMFDDANLLLISPLHAGHDGRMVRGPVGCDVNKIKEFVDKYATGFDVELNKTVGFRLVHSSRSAQVRRKAAAGLLKHAKKDAEDELGLSLQYDKPWDLREKQTLAHKFLAALKNNSGGVVVSKTVKSGFLVVNDIRLAPEYLVPKMHRWDNLLKLVLQKVRGWGNRAPLSPETGAMADVFGAEYAADHGVFDLDALPLNNYGDGWSDDDDMQTAYAT
jgi:hypothetical protein